MSTFPQYNNNSNNNNDELMQVPGAGGCCESIDIMPDACSNDDRTQKLIQRQARDDERNPIRRFLERERNLLISCVVIVVAMNFSEGRYLLYPFKIFSTWIHEMCHGFAAILTGGRIAEINVFADGSGLAYTSCSNSWKRGFIASAGYPGTAVTGCLLLLFRRTTLGPTIGTIGIGLCMIMTCIFWVRGTFGFFMILGEGITFCLLGWGLPAHFLDNLYSFLAATCCLNAFESIQDLFAIGSYVVGGEEVNNSDAHTVAEKWGLDYRFWACWWLTMSLVLTVVGIVFARDAKDMPWSKDRPQNGTTPYPQYGYTYPEVTVTDVEYGKNVRNTSAAAVY